MSELTFDYLLKYIIVGDSCKFWAKLVVGKSNILLKWTKNKFKTDHEITIGVEFGARNLKIEETNKNYRIQVWDTVRY
jgi:Ras-related protein Rab-2A